MVCFILFFENNNNNIREYYLILDTVTVVLRSQWGDEGKGKLVDINAKALTRYYYRINII